MRYEIHTCVKGRWGLDSVFDDRTIALDEAHTLVNRGKAKAGIKVIEDSDEGKPSRTIFFYSAAAAAKMEKAKQHRQVVREVEAARVERNAKKESERAAAAAPPPKGPIGSQLIFRLTLILIGGLAALGYLRYTFME